jgi:hypothetical protein
MPKPAEGKAWRKNFTPANATLTMTFPPLEMAEAIAVPPSGKGLELRRHHSRTGASARALGIFNWAAFADDVKKRAGSQPEYRPGRLISIGDEKTDLHRVKLDQGVKGVYLTRRGWLGIMCPPIVCRRLGH